MTFICNRPCENKNPYGYCLTSYCIYPSPVPNVIYEKITPTTRACAVCGEYEDKDGVTVKTVFWMCDKCIGKLKKLLNEEVKDEQTNV